MNNSEPHEGLRVKNPKFLKLLHKPVVLAVQILAVFMVFVIWLAIVDVGYHLYNEIVVNPRLIAIENLIAVLGDFLAVLIAIEIFMNIVFYLTNDSINAPLVLSTALTAVSRKLIVLDYKTVTPNHLYAVAAVVLAIGFVYWLIVKKT